MSRVARIRVPPLPPPGDPRRIEYDHPAAIARRSQDQALRVERLEYLVSIMWGVMSDGTRDAVVREAGHRGALFALSETRHRCRAAGRLFPTPPQLQRGRDAAPPPEER